MEIADKLIKWFQNDSYRERITRVVLLWVNNHFNDFESDMDMTEFLQSFESALEANVSKKCVVDAQQAWSIHKIALT